MNESAEGARPIGNLWHHLRVVWTHPIHFVLAIGIGAVGAFVYSYGPLHRAEQWQIGYLEERVDEQNRGLRALEEELGALRAEADSRPDPASIASERKKAAAVRRELADAEASAKKSERTIANLRRSVTQWKSRYEKASQELDSLRAASAPAAPPAFGVMAESNEAPPEAAGETPGDAVQPLAAPDPAEIP